MGPFATVDDVEELWRTLKESETDRATKLLEVVSDSLRMEADKVGKDLDKMIDEKPSYFINVVKSVVVDIVGRTLMTSTDSEPMTQTTESALGYSWSGSFLVPGGGLFIKNTELSRLGLRKQRYGVIEFYGEN
ncbi:phage Gp19/Gp15/Gp42 family protein [Carnobacterium maltaromaticum]|uniref:phage Gp19/Gp15/Gp42 family protein n=1 Tax=Carnobacterium maltaromaticum TaxID=2751 RepID=UPI0039AF8DC6